MKTLLVSALCFFVFSALAPAADPEGSQEIADRYEQMLLRTPEPGTAFDKVVDWYSSTSGLATLQQRWKENADPAHRRSLLILQGLLAQRQDRPDEARKLFQEALTLDGEKVLAAKPLAALEATEGNFPAAADAYAAALSSETLSPPQRLDLMRSLALLYQRAFEPDKAIAVWRDAVAKYPDDPFVQDEAGEAFLAAGSYEDARKSFSRQRDLATDPFQKISASLRIARALELEGKIAEAQAIYESALEETAAGSWINREVRGQVEALFRRKDDLPGLLAFYEKRLKAAPQDYTTLVSQSKVLEELGRTEEAIASARRAADLAPDETSLRLNLVRLLAANERPDDAQSELAELAKSPSASAEILTLSGNLQWAIHEKQRDDASRTAALEAWNRLAPPDSKDIARIGQLAEILGSKGLTDEAAAQWQRLSALAPELPEPRVRLAEIALKKSDKDAALKILAGLVEGPLAEAPNFVTLARIQERLELDEQARETTARGLKLFPENFDLLNLAWRQAINAKDSDAAARLYPELWRQSPGEFAAGEAEKRYADFLDTTGQAPDLMKTLLAGVEKNEIPPPQLGLLFRLALQHHDETNARLALEKIRAGENAVRAARAGLEFAKLFGSADDQIAAQQAIAAADPRLATESLRAAARLLAESGRPEAAFDILTKLLEKSPADLSLYTLYSDLAARSGNFEEAARQLKRGIRQVDDATTLRLQLATLLDAQGRSAEALAVIEEAFENESTEARRMEIFRRQVEFAQRAGKLDDLIASLREKQQREQNGARYGTYLAEIYLAQDDYLAARDELTRSLGRSPDDAAALTRLIDLAERGGDREESLRLAKRLAEVAPSAANRAALLSRLFDSGEKAAGLEELARVRAEIVKDPKTWNPALTALRRAGQTAEFDALIEEMAGAAAPDIVAQAEMARLRLQQQNEQAAEKILWGILASGDLAEATDAVSKDVPAQYAALPGNWALAFQFLFSDIQNFLHQALNSARGYFPMSSASRGFGKATAEQRELISSAFLLSMLADARNDDEAFMSRLRQLLADRDVPRLTRLMLLQLVNDRSGVAELVRQQAEEARPDPEIDRHLAPLHPDPLWDENLKIIRERLAKDDPAFDLEQTLDRTAKELTAKTVDGATPPSEYRRVAETLSKHPGLASSPGSAMRIALWAAQGGDFGLAFRLCDQVATAKGNPKSTPPFQNPAHPSGRAGIVALAIAAQDPRAEEELEKFLQTAIAAAKPSTFHFSSFGMRMAPTHAPLAQPNPDLVAGVASFPVPVFRNLFTSPSGAEQTAKIQKWFASRASQTELTTATLGAIYADWFAGRREEALKRLEAVHRKSPTPESAALLVEIYEKLERPADALALLDAAPLQPEETTDVRNVRKVRLLRAAERKEEATGLAERMVRGRLSPIVREALANELQLLGRPPDSFRNLTANSFPRLSQSKDRSEPVRLQVSKLVADKQTDEAERIATQFLARPLPSRQDYQAINARHNMVSLIQSMGRGENYKQAMQAQLDRDPDNLESAVRLAEASLSGNDSQATAGQLCEFIVAHPQRHAAMPYALQLLMRRSDGKGQAAQAVAAMLRADPEIFSTGVLQIHELQNFLSDPGSAAIFTEMFASMDEQTFNRVFQNSRLTYNPAEFAIVLPLATAAAGEGKTDQAIALLTRLRPTAEKNLDSGLPAILTLAELQLEKGDKAAAAETITSLVNLRASRRFGYGAGTTSLQSLLVSKIYNPQNWKSSEELFRRLQDVAQKTETQEALMASFEQPRFGNPAISPALILRTTMEKPGFVEEWRRIVLDRTTAGPIPPSLLPIVLKAFAREKDAPKLVTSLLAKAGHSGGSHYALSTVAEVVPLLGNLKDDPAIAKFISSQISLALSDPYNSGYLLFSESYPACLLALLDAGFDEEARRLFDITAAQRNSGRFGRRPEMEEVERRFKNTSERVAAITAVVTAPPSATARKTLYWRIFPSSPPSEYLPSDTPVSWTNQGPRLPKNLHPTILEIFAGPNPAALERVAQKNHPALSGSVEANVPGSVGLVQARWKLSDGSTGSGPLTVYLTGENLIRNKGIPESKPDRPMTPYKSDQPGPGGEKSAVLYEKVSPSSQLNIPLMNISLDDKDDTYVFCGWFGTAKDQAAAPSLDVRLIYGDGRVDERRNGYTPMPVGQWIQNFTQWSQNSQAEGNIPAAVKQLDLTLTLQSNRGYNNQYMVAGLWDNLQIIRLNKDQLLAEAPQNLKTFHEAISKKDYPAAANAFLAALRLHPSSALQQPPSQIVDAFKKSSRLPELFAQVGSPSLLLPNPLLNKRPTLNNPGLVAALTAEALDSATPPAAKKWLASLANASLPDETRFAVEAGILTEAVKREPGKAKAAEILKVLGFDPESPNSRRLNSLWHFQGHGKPTPALLELLTDETISAEALKQLSAMNLPGNVETSRLLVQAWLTAPTDPAKALTLAHQAHELFFNGQSSAYIANPAQTALLLRIAQKHPEPGALVAAFKTWLTRGRQDENFADRNVVEFLHDASESDIPRREEFATLWADAEIAALKTAGYNGSRDRVRKLAFRLMENADWERLDAMLGTFLSKKSLTDETLRKEFVLLQNIAGFARGKTDFAWPVVWCKPGTGSREVAVSWQWNIRDTSPDRGDFDTAVSIAPKPLLPEIPGQQSVEIFFGEMPSDMTLLAKAEGSAAQGTVTATLPAANGFLRAVAVFDGKRHPGPLTPVLSGRRVYPPGDTTLRDLLLSGSEPMAPVALTASGEAPDGSPALRLGDPTEREPLRYNGPEFSVTPGKFYASRGWMRRAGTGAGTTSSEFKPIRTSTKNSLNMLLSEGMEATGQWVLYTRAVPVVNQHTFWIPMDEVASMVPRLWNVAPGTELAGFELLEIDDWKYGQWIVDLAMLRKNAGDPPDTSTLDRAVALAALEPLTAMDYHGDWLARTLTAADRPEDLLKLARTALSAEANPLFSRPKLGRIFDYLLGVLHRGDGPAEFRRDLAGLILESPTRTSAPQRAATLAYATLLATPENRPEAVRSAREELAKKLDDATDGPGFLRALLTARSGRGDRPANEFLHLLLALNDAETSALFLREIQGKKGGGLTTADRIFATIALEAAQADATVNPKWTDEVARAFKATANLDSPDAYMRWPFVLADFLAGRNLAPEVVTSLRQESLRRVLAAKPEHNGRTSESIRAAAFLIEHTLAQKGDAHETVEAILPVVQAGAGTLHEGSLRLLLRSIKLLSEAGASADAASLAKAAEPALSRFPKMSDEFSPFLPKS